MLQDAARTRLLNQTPEKRQEALAGAWQDFAQADSAEAGCGAWLALQCAMLDGARAGVVVLDCAPEMGGGQFSPAAVWPEGASPGRLLAEAADRALSEKRPLIVSPPASSPVASCGIAFPIRLGDHLGGVAAVELSVASEAGQEAALRQLQWGAAALEALFWRDESRRSRSLSKRLAVVLDAAAMVLEQEGTANAASAALMTELAARLSCDRVSLALVRKDHAELVAMSHTAEFGGKMSLVRAIEAAADEAIDQRSTLSYPATSDAETLALRDHAALSREHASGAILTIPFFGGDEFRGAVCFERAIEQGFEAEEVELCEALVAFVARILELKTANEVPLRRRLRAAWRKQAEDFLGPRYFGRKLSAGIALLLALFFTFATGEYRVSGNAALEGQVRRVLAAPFDGYVGSAMARAGDVVKAGSPLATLDDRDLRLERLRWASQHAQFSRQFQEAMAKHDRGQALVFQAQIQQAEAQLVLVDEQLARSILAAPFDGLVASGDLSQLVGGSVRKGQVLFEITPLNGYRVIIHVDEGEVTDVRAGQKGTLVLSSIADDSLPFVVSVVTPVTGVRDGANTFRVEAVLEHNSDRLRPGMEGVAKISAGERRLIWIWTHRMVNWLRLAVWSWLP